MKRILSLLLAVTMLVSGLPVQAFATVDTTAPTETVVVETTAAEETTVPEETDPSVPETTEETAMDPSVPETTEEIVVETTEGASETTETVEVTETTEATEETVAEEEIGFFALRGSAENFSGKVISVMGDSISTFAGYIPTADGFNLEHLARYPQADLLTDVNETWWMQVITALDAKLGINDSWRGATLSGGAPVTTGTTGENAAMSNLVRIQNLGANGTPDIILLYGGTNDLAHVSKVGSFNANTAPSTVDLTTAKWDNLADGLVHTILRMRHYYPNAQIVALLPAVTASYYSNEKLAEGNAVMAQICEHYGVPYADLRECGITTADLPDGIHPNAAGMDYITEAVLDVLLSQCEMEAGENKVYSVSHLLTGAKADKHYYKGISAGAKFEETISGEDLTVTVTMGGVDITSSAYADGRISIANVTGDLVITAKAVFSLGERLQQLPEKLCAGTNLWTALEHDKEYYTASGWGVHGSGKVYSVTFPVSAGDRIYATSFRKGGENGTTTNGIRVTYFGTEGMLKSLPSADVYNEYTQNGWLTVPEGANAVNVPMWTKDDSNELFLLNAEHSYKNGVCKLCGETDSDRLSLDGLNVLCLGDSITAGQGLTTDTRWTNVLASKYGWTLTNKSQGGISLTSYYYTANGQTDVSIAKKAEILKTMTTKPDVIIVWGGHNDTSYRASPLGTWEDNTTDSFKGALKHIAELADEYAPDATLFVLTPLWNNEKPSTLKVPENTTDTNWMFVDAIYEGAEKYGWIPINMDLCGITPYNKTAFLLDNIHPNTAGTEKIVEYLSAELASYGANSKKETIISNESSVAIKVGESVTLKAVLSPRSGNGSPAFVWSASDTSVATVDSNGVVTSVAPGNATITVAVADGTAATISVSVEECVHSFENGKCTICGAADENPWTGKTAVFVGDSITAGTGTDKIYYQYLKEALGFGSVTAMGVGGSCISAASDYGQSTQPLINRYQNIPSEDLIVIFMGTNDYGHETPLGTMADTQDGTFYGTLNTIIPALVEKHTSSKIVFVTPLHRYGFGTSKILGTQFTSDSIPNGVGAALGDYVEALKAVCENNGVSVIDLYTQCTLDPADSAVREEYMPDGLHPNAAGHAVIAGIMETHIRGYAPVEEETAEPLALKYDDHYDISGKTVEIVDAGKPTSYQVGYGVAEGTLDTAVVTVKGEKLVATGIGTAKVRMDGQLYEVTVTAAPISLLLLAGQSNMQGIDGNANESIVCADGMVYATYADRYKKTVEDVTKFAPSALAGQYSTTNVTGDAACLENFPVNMLTDAGNGREGMDSGLAYEWVKQTGEKVWVINLGYGGSSINGWLKGQEHYEACYDLFTACQETLRKEIAAGHFTLSHMGYFWCQGCADEVQTAQWYAEKFQTMHELFKSELAFDQNTTFEFAGIIPIRSGHQGAGSYRAGVYTDTTSVPYFQSFKDLRFNGPRVAQYWMGNNPELKDIWNVCTIQEDWATLPDGTNGVAAYFQSAYPNGTVDYTTQVQQSAAWYKPTTPAAVHDNIHYNQIGYNELGRESARNALILLGETKTPEAKATVEFLTWDGFTPAKEITTATVGVSGTLVVPMVSPVWKSKEITYATTDGLRYEFYDLLAEDSQTEGSLKAVVADADTITVVPRDLASYRWNFDGTNLVSDVSNGNTENTLTKTAGSITNGQFNGVQYQTALSIQLLHEEAWEVEVQLGNWNSSTGMMVLSGSQTSTDGQPFFYFRPWDYFVGIGKYDGSKFHNYGISLKNHNIACEEGTHTYRFVNCIAEDGSNMIDLYVDGQRIGALTDHYINSDFSDSDNHSLSGWDFNLPYLGTSNAPLGNCVINYLSVKEMNADKEALSLRYDDHYDISGKTVEIVDAGKPTSYQVGYGVAEGTLDTAVVTVKGEKLVATGIGTAKVRIDGQLYEVTVTAAPISLLLLIGQSNMRGSEGNAKQSIVCPDGMVYSTYGDDRGADNTAMTVNNATQFAPSALTGEYSKINVEGTTSCLSGYPLDSLTEDGDGRMGPDSGFAYEWVKQTGEKVWVVNAAHGGTSITTWQDGGDNYEEAVKLFSACQETLRKEIAAGHFTLSHMGYFWCQGCSDRTQTAKWYVNKYLAMHQNLKTELAFDADSNAQTADVAFAFGGIIPVRVGSSVKCYRDGVYETSNPYAYHESYVDLRFNGPRVAQYWMINNPELTDIWGVCNIGEDWVNMPDGTNGVADYFKAHYENGTVDYTTQVKQSASWYTPTTPAAVHDSIHYNQIGYNEIGRESVRNALILLGEMETPAVATDVKLVSWDGYTEVTEVSASTTGNSETLVVPMVYPLWKSKEVTASVTDGLTYEYYDLLAASGNVTGKLTVNGESVSVVKGQPGLLYADHLSQLPENLCSGLNLWNVLEHDKEYFASGTNWGVYSGGTVCSVTIPVKPGDKIFATSFGKAGENGHTSSNGIRTTFFGEYSVVKTMNPADTYAEFSKNGGYLIAPEGATAINVAMWNGEDTNELYILNAEHSYKDGKCIGCGEKAPSLVGKTISILGASISTYAGTSNGAAADTTNSTIRNNAKYYPNTIIPELGLNDTWWMQVAEDLDLRLLVNNAWSGSAILLERAGTVGAYVDRCVQLHDNTGDNAGEEPDIICIQMGFNDFSYGKDTLGDANIDYAALITADGYGTPSTTMEATAIMLDKITKRYPNAEVYMFNHFKRIGQSASDTALMESLNASIDAVCDRFGVTVVDLYTTLTEPAHIGDGRVHPNCLGMDVISEAVKSAIIGNTAYEVTTHTVSFNLNGVTADYGTDKIVVDGSSFTAKLAASAGDDLSVIVTMGGKDITSDCYDAEDGKIFVEAVTADVEIFAKSVHTPKDYRWEFDGTDLVGDNTLTKTAGTTNDGIFSATRYDIATSVVLSHEEPWVVEWKSEGTFENVSGSGARVFTSDKVNANYNARYIFKSNTKGIIAMGEKTTTGSHNYGIALEDYGIDWTALHTYRLENRIAEDGSNMVYLYVDGKEIGPMTHYFVGTTDKNTTSDWLSGKDFVFPYMGTDTHSFNDCAIEYIAVWEGGKTEKDPADFSGKTFSILGDSISTFAGVSNNTSFNSTIGNNELYYTEGRQDVYLEDTWWQQVMDALDMNLCVNNSWSGSTVFYPRKGVGSEGYVSRCVQLHSDQNPESPADPDVIAVFLGTNDFSYYQSTLGTADIDYDAIITDNGDGTFAYAEPATSCEAYAIMLHKMQQRYPDAQVYCMLMLPRRGNTTQPTAFNAELTEIIEHFGYTAVDLENCGITPEPEIFDVYITDKRVHPGPLGMNRIAEAVVSTMLGKKTDIHRVKWTGDAYYVQVGDITWKDSVLTGERITTTFQPEPGFEITSITVTMGGEDISRWTVNGNTVTIDSVTGDVEVTIETAVEKREPLNFRWESIGADLFETENANNTKNKLTKLGGTVSNGVLSNTHYRMETPVQLRHDMAWVVEWFCGGDWSGMLLSAEGTSGIEGNTYLFRSNQNTDFLGFGERRGGNYHNYGIALADYGIKTDEYHYYRLENRWDYEKETNMVYLMVDGVELGAMNNYFIGGTSDQNKTVDWVSGKDFVFSYMGTDGHALNNMKPDFVQVWERAHIHTYESVVTKPTCTEKGYTTHTCSVCGDSYVDSYVDVVWHSYEEGCCSMCGCDMIRISRDDITMYQGGVNSENGTLNTTFTNNWYTNIRIPIGAEQVHVLTFKTGGNWGSAFLKGADYLSGFCDKEVGGQWITVDVPNEANVFRYGYLYDEIAQKNNLPTFQYLEFAGEKLETPEDSGYMDRPGTGCHSFSVEVNIAPAMGKDGYVKGTDYGYIQLPTNYSPYGDPTRLIIVCHGAGADISTYQSDAWKNTNYSFWTDLGYAVMDMYACPPELTGNDDCLHYGNPVVLECYKKGYEYVLEKFNLKQDGIFLIGSSMGGLSSFQIAQSEQFPVIAQVGYCPAIDLFKQAYCNPWTTASYQRGRIASYFGFTGTAPTFTNNKYPSAAEIEYYRQNFDKTIAYSPILRNVVDGDMESIFDVIPSSATAMDAAEAAIYAQLTATHPNPLMIFHNTDDATVSYRYSQYLVDMLNRSGQDAQLRTFTSGGHNAWANGANVTVQGINGNITLKESQYEAYLFFEKFEKHEQHQSWVDPAVKPTCTETGLTEGEHCAVCGEILVAQTTVAATGHSYESVITQPTCTEKGYTTHTCSVCGDSYVDSYVDATGEHSYEDRVTFPKNTVKGHTDYVCTVCGHAYQTAWLDPAAYEGKTLAAIGDSITCGVGVTADKTDYVYLLAQQLGMDYIRLGASGTTLCTDGHRTCNIGKLTESNLADADVVTILMGINDFCNAKDDYYTLGDITSTDSSTIYGAVRMWCEKIQQLRQKDSLADTQFYFVTPLITSWNNSVSSSKDWDQSKTNIHGYTLRDLCNAIVEVCALYDVPVIDLNLTSGLYYVSAEDNNTAMFGGDGVHPGVTGHEMMADALEDALLQNELRDDHAHAYGSWITTDYPGCNEAGTQMRVCAECRATESRKLAVTGHSYESVVTKPTCTEKGYTTHTCTVCGDSYVDSYTDPRPLNVLMIGNSFSWDAADFWYDMQESMTYDAMKAMLAEAYDIHFAVMYKGSATLGYHATCAMNNTAQYTYTEIGPDTNYVWTPSSGKNANNSIQSALEKRDWDIIVIQSYQHESDGTDPRSTYTGGDKKFEKPEASMGYLLDYFAEKEPTADVYYYMPWATTKFYGADGLEAGFEAMARYSKDHMIHMTGTNSGKSLAGFIPVGTGIQNARTTYLHDLYYTSGTGSTYLLKDPQIGLQYDTQHLSFGIGRYIAGVIVAESLIPEELRKDSYSWPTIKDSPAVGAMPAEYNEIAQKAIEGALKTPYALTAISGYEEDPCSTMVNAIAKKDFDLTGVTNEAQLKAAITEQVKAMLTKEGFAEPIVTVKDSKFVDGKLSTCQATVTLRFGYTTKDAEIVKHTHIYESVVTKPTCTEKGYTTHTCACGDSYVDSYVEATGHTAVIDPAIKANSARPGITEGSHCDTCGNILEAQKEIPAKGYEWMLEDGEFKILLIGNSFSQDASGYGTESQLYNILQSMLGADVKITLGLLYSGGKGVHWHATQAEQGTTKSGFYVITADNQKWTSKGGTKTQVALAWADWDVVTLQPYDMNFSTEQESVPYPVETDEKFYPLEAATEYMLDYIDEYAPQADVYCYMHWARSSATVAAMNASLSTYRKFAAFYPKTLDYVGTESGNRYTSVIPVGLSIQNARTTYLAELSFNVGTAVNIQNDPQIGLQRDGGHLTYNIGRYIAGMTFAEMVIPVQLRAAGYVLPSIRVTESVGKLPAEYTEIAQKSVLAAVNSWKNGKLDEVITIANYEKDPINTIADAYTVDVPCVADMEALKDGIAEAVCKQLAEDFVVENVILPETFTLTGKAQIVAVSATVRFGYSDKTVEINVDIAGHTEVIDKAVEATCTETGLTEGKHCSVCETVLVKQNVVPAKGHSYGDWTETKAATCTETGEERRDCANCDHFETREIAAKGHTEVIDKAVDATCTESGLTEGKHCSVCETVLVKQNVIPAVGHIWDEGEVSKQPSPIEDGERIYTCKVCGATKTEVIPAFGHNHTYESVVTQPTCTEKGYTTYTCVTCGDSYVDNEVPALGHSYESVVTKPTCTEKGYTTHTCTACGDSYVDGETAALGHIEVIDKAVEATCTEPGLTEGKHCSVCETVLVKQNVVPAKGHNYESVVTKPTCTEKGYTTHTCTACGDSYVDSETAALGHKWDDGKVTREPTETVQGEKVYTCTVCGETRIEILPVLGHEHSYTSVETKPTCTEKGYTTYTCNCGHSYIDNEVPALGHTEVIDKAVDATCTETGLTEGKHCSVCETVLVKQNVIPAKGHSYESVVTKPTCTEKGYTTHTCTACGDSYVDSETAALGHKWDDGKVTREPTETVQGEKVYTCTVCGETRIEILPVLGHEHSYTSVETKPTCTEKGYTTYTCNCGHSYIDNEVPALGHTEVIDKAVDATCTETGLTEGKHCSVCETVLVKQNVVPAKGHSFGSWVESTAPTCTESGEQKRECACGHVESRSVDALGHEEVVDEGVKPTCTEGGISDGKHCSRCGEILKAQENLPATGHSYGEEPELHWNEERTSCKIHFLCGDCDAIKVLTRPVLKEIDDENGEIVYTVTFQFGGKNYTETIREAIADPDEHRYDTDPKFFWSENNTSCKAYFHCSHCDGIKVKVCTVTSETDTENKKILHTATVEFEGKTFTDVREEVLKDILWGDANGDGRVNAMDATRILRYAAKLVAADQIDLTVSDVNDDGKVNAMDATRILRYAAKLITELRTEKLA